MRRENDDQNFSEGTWLLSSGFGRAQVPLPREKRKAWKGRANRRGRLPTLAPEQDGDSGVNQPHLRSPEEIRGKQEDIYWDWDTKPGLHSDLVIKLGQCMNSFIYCVFFKVLFKYQQGKKKVQRKQNINSGLEIIIYNQFWILFSSFLKAPEEFSRNSKHFKLRFMFMIC